MVHLMFMKHQMGIMYERDYNGTLIQFYENDGYITKVKIQAYE